MTRTEKIPDASHPITIGPASERVVVSLGDVVIADTRAALRLQEASYPPVLYVPREDVVAGALEASDTGSHCPYKGDASYFSLSADGREVADVAWSYERPHGAVAEIAGHLAFYPDRVAVAVQSE